MRIGIVGSGVAGLTAAYLLAPHAQVTLYEKDARLGGHAHTEQVSRGDTTVSVDTGFMVYNPSAYPHFMELLRQLDVSSTETIMSFSVSIPGVVAYNSDLRGIFGSAQQITSVRYWKFLGEILRFNRLAKQLLAQQSPESLTLGSFFKRHHLSEDVAHWYVYPLIGSIWSAGNGALTEYPAHETFAFLNNHRLLNVFNKPRWRTVTEGSRTYVERLTQKLRGDGVSILWKCPVTRITRKDSLVEVSSKNGTELFDHVICATHADEALTILTNPTPAEQAALKSFSYATNTVILHSDPSFMPPARHLWASWNYHDPLISGNEHATSLTYWMNNLQHIPHAAPLFVTLNPSRDPKPELQHATYCYAHPIFNEQARAAQLALKQLEPNTISFVGAHLGFGFHEDGVQSAIDAVTKLGFSNRLKKD